MTVSFNRGNTTKMNNTSYTDGMMFFNTSDKRIYLDDGGERLQYGGDTQLISQVASATDTNVFNASASVILFTQKTTVVDTKSAALNVNQNYIPLGCLAFKETIGTTNFSSVGSTVSGALVNLKNTTTNLSNQLVANGVSMYMDYHNGKYGVNTSSSRGADTFIPFNKKQWYYLGEGSAWDVTQYDGWQNFNVNNFVFEPNNVSIADQVNAYGPAEHLLWGLINCNTSIYKNYNRSTGVFSATLNYNATATMDYNYNKTNATTVGGKAWLIIDN